MFKKFSRYIAVAITALTCTLTGCFLFKDGETINWNKVDTVASGIKVLSQTTIYAVCYKNTDLAPIFKAIGEGLIVISGSAATEQMSPEQIQKYINDLLSKYGTLGTQVNAITTTLIAEYNKFWQNNSAIVKDEAKVVSKVVKALGEGFVVGASVVPQITTVAMKPDEKSPELKAADAQLRWANICLKVTDPIK